jgi:hypothetical protein
MRGVDRFYSDPHIDTSGRHLPATLHRLASETEAGGGPEQLYARITARLAEIVPTKDNEGHSRLAQLPVSARSEELIPR